jgi:hypothetical protein
MTRNRKEFVYKNMYAAYNCKGADDGVQLYNCTTRMVSSGLLRRVALVRTDV